MYRYDVSTRRDNHFCHILDDIFRRTLRAVYPIFNLTMKVVNWEGNKLLLLLFKDFLTNLCSFKVLQLLDISGTETINICTIKPYVRLRVCSGLFLSYHSIRWKTDLHVKLTKAKSEYGVNTAHYMAAHRRFNQSMHHICQIYFGDSESRLIDLIKGCFLFSWGLKRCPLQRRSQGNSFILYFY